MGLYFSPWYSPTQMALSIDLPPVGTGQTGSIIMSSSEKVDQAWEFLKWWTSTEVQTEFGRQIESVLGPAGRYATANVEALAGLPWSVEEYNKLIAQWNGPVGFQKSPGDT